MTGLDLDSLVDQLMPQVLNDRELGDGSTFTGLHFTRLWALSCLHAGECFDEQLLACRVARCLPPRVTIAREVRV
jgi:hypothetical protein